MRAAAWVPALAAGVAGVLTHYCTRMVTMQGDDVEIVVMTKEGVRTDTLSLKRD